MLASRLAEARSKPSVLLVEAGAPQPTEDDLAISNRFTLFATQKDLNWGYASAPEKNLNKRNIDISRGRGLGGSTNINYQCWTPPNKAAIDQWQHRVGGDGFFSWEASQRIMGRIAKYSVRDLKGDFGTSVQGMTDRLVTEYVANPVHQGNGSFGVEYSSHLKQGDARLLDGMAKHGFARNPDMLSGNTIGFGIMPASSYDGRFRQTASTAFLTDPPPNLTIRAGAQVTRILFKDKTAKAVEVAGSEITFEARHSIVLSAGAIDTPKLLMLSGVGPQDHLAAHNIPLIAHAPAVGQHLKDHSALLLSWKVDEEFAGLPLLPSVSPVPNQDMLNVVVDFDHDETMINQPGFTKLAQEDQEFLRRADTATLEILAVANWVVSPEKTRPSVTLVPVHLTPQSSGSITLSSSDWKDPADINLSFFSDAGGLDLASAVAHVRKCFDFMEKTESLSRHIISRISGPKSDQEEDVVAFVRKETNTLWHPSCTARMGPENDSNEDSAIDTHFKVRGVENLRVADLSVAPIIPNFHPVSMALLIGAWAAERMIAEYGL